MYYYLSPKKMHYPYRTEPAVLVLGHLGKPVTCMPYNKNLLLCSLCVHCYGSRMSIEQFDPVAWKAEIASRKGKTLKDWTVLGMMKFISTHAFKTANSPDWPNQHLGELFGASRVVHGVYRVCRNMHGYNVIVASGKFLPAHAARLSDMVEAIFGKYRLELSRARWNFSEDAARADLLNESSFFKILEEFENLLLEKKVIPPVECMPAIRAVVSVRGAAIAGAAKKRRENTEILKAEIAAFKQQLKVLEEAAGVRLEEHDAAIAEAKTNLADTRENFDKLLRTRLVGVEERIEELHKLVASCDSRLKSL